MLITPANSELKFLQLHEERKFPDGVGYIFHTQEGFPVYTKSRVTEDGFEGAKKWKIVPSLTSGCPVRCEYCFTNGMSHFYPLSSDEICEEVNYAANRPFDSYDLLKIEFKNMGDPLMNSTNTLNAIRTLGCSFPYAQFSVSTSGPNDPDFSNPQKFFEELQRIRDGGLETRLQFSCQSTSEDDRKRLHAHIPMLSLYDFSGVVNDWYTGDDSSRVTLTFVPFSHYELNADHLREVFDPEKVFVKLAYVSENIFTRDKGLINASPEAVEDFREGLEKNGFRYAIKPVRVY